MCFVSPGFFVKARFSDLALVFALAVGPFSGIFLEHVFFKIRAGVKTPCICMCFGVSRIFSKHDFRLDPCFCARRRSVFRGFPGNRVFQNPGRCEHIPVFACVVVSLPDVFPTPDYRLDPSVCARRRALFRNFHGNWVVQNFGRCEQHPVFACVFGSAGFVSKTRVSTRPLVLRSLSGRFPGFPWSTHFSIVVPVAVIVYQPKLWSRISYKPKINLGHAFMKPL